MAEGLPAAKKVPLLNTAQRVRHHWRRSITLPSTITGALCCDIWEGEDEEGEEALEAGGCHGAPADSASAPAPHTFASSAGSWIRTLQPAGCHCGASPSPTLSPSCS